MSKAANLPLPAAQALRKLPQLAKGLEAALHQVIRQAKKPQEIGFPGAIGPTCTAIGPKTSGSSSLMER